MDDIHRDAGINEFTISCFDGGRRSSPCADEGGCGRDVEGLHSSKWIHPEFVFLASCFLTEEEQQLFYKHRSSGRKMDSDPP